MPCGGCGGRERGAAGLAASAGAAAPAGRTKPGSGQRGPTAKEKAAFVWKHRFLIVKRSAKLTQAERKDLKQLLAYLPGLRPLWSFSQDLYRLLDDSKTLRVARWRYTWLRYDPKYQQVRELVAALDLLAEPKLTKAMAFVGQPAGSQVRTNNHVERLNRRLRFAEKVRYRWRKRKWVVRWVVLLLNGCWQQAAEASAAAKGAKPSEQRSPPQPSAKSNK